MPVQERKIIKYVLKDLPIEKIEYDDKQPRKNLSVVVASLRPSIDRHGVQQPITVTEYRPNHYKIIEGHRRYLSAKELGFLDVPSLIYPAMTQKEIEVRRYEMQNLRRPWKPMEKSNALYSLKEEFGFRSNKELAEYVGISEWTAANYAMLKNQKDSMIEKMFEYKLNETFQMEMVKLRMHMCKITGMEVEQIVDDILDRIKKGIITNSKELRILKSAFIRIDLYAEVLAGYLSNPEMKVRELQEQILRNGFSWNVQKLIADVAKKKSRGEKLTEKETDALNQLRKLIEEVL